MWKATEASEKGDAVGHRKSGEVGPTIQSTRLNDMCVGHSHYHSFRNAIGPKIGLYIKIMNSKSPDMHANVSQVLQTLTSFYLNFFILVCVDVAGHVLSFVPDLLRGLDSC